MSEKLTFPAQTRTIMGKKVKQLRTQGLVPANIMSHNQDSLPISVNALDFTKLYRKAGDTTLIYVTIDGETKARPVLIEDLEVHPVTDQVLHIVFKQVNLKEKIKAQIPVELVGEFSIDGAVLLTVRDSIEVEALPTDLPEKFEINVELLTKIGQVITFDDLSYDKTKVELQVSEEERTSPVVIVQEVKEEIEEAPEAGVGIESSDTTTTAEADTASDAKE